MNEHLKNLKKLGILRVARVNKIKVICYCDSGKIFEGTVIGLDNESRIVMLSVDYSDIILDIDSIFAIGVNSEIEPIRIEFNQRVY